MTQSTALRERNYGPIVPMADERRRDPFDIACAVVILAITAATLAFIVWSAS